MTKVIARVHPVHLMSLTCSKLYHISVTVPQDNGITKWMVGPIYLTLGRGKHPTAHCVPAPLITVHQLCMLDTEHIVSTVKCKFNSQKCCSIDCCFVLGWWVQCHVLCQQWCCACWSWWNTQSYEAFCCTGDAQRGSVNYCFKTFLELFVTISGVQIEYGNDRLTIFNDFDTKSGNYQKHRVIWSLLLYWRHLTWLGELYL